MTATRSPVSFTRFFISSSQKDILLSVPWLVLYSLAEIALALMVSALVQMIYVETPRVSIQSLVPEKFRHMLVFGQTIDRKDVIFVLPLIIILFGFVKSLASFLSNYLIERSGQFVGRSLRAELLRKYLSCVGKKCDEYYPEVLSNRIVTDTLLVQEYVSRSVISLVRDAFVVVSSFVIMIFLSYRMTLIGLLIGLPLAILLRLMARKISYFASEGIGRQVELAQRVIQSRKGLLTIFGMKTQKREYEDLVRLIYRIYRLMRRSFLVRTSFRPLTELLAIIGVCLVLQWKFKGGTLVFSEFTTIALLAAISFRPLKNLSTMVSQWSEFQSVYFRIENLWNELDSHSLSEEKLRYALPRKSDQAIEIVSLQFEEQGGKKILDNIHLDIKKGTKNLLVGPSGSGKTTLLRLISGVLQPSAGEIKRLENCMLVTQEPYLFKGTVLENVLYTFDEKDPMVLHRAENILRDLHLIHSELGFKYLVNRNLNYFGDGLSGGEKMRISLARALLRDPSILCVDEVTANLDSETSSIVWNALFNWCKEDKDRTLIAVTHVVSHQEMWDHCVYLEHGHILKKGTPKEVIGT